MFSAAGGAGGGGEGGRGAGEAGGNAEDARAGLGKGPGLRARREGEPEFTAGQQVFHDARGGKRRGESEEKAGDFQSDGDEAAVQEFPAAKLQRERIDAREGVGLSGQSEASVANEHAAVGIQPDVAEVQGETFGGERAVEQREQGAGHAQAAVLQDAELENQGGGQGQPERPKQQSAAHAAGAEEKPERTRGHGRTRRRRGGWAQGAGTGCRRIQSASRTGCSRVNTSPRRSLPASWVPPPARAAMASTSGPSPGGERVASRR